MSTPQENYSYQTPPPLHHTSTPAIISIICGVLGWLGVFGLGGILAVIFGHVAKNEIRRSGGLIEGDGIATIGLVLGYTNIAITIVGICVFILILLGLIASPLLCFPFFNNVNMTFTTIP